MHSAAFVLTVLTHQYFRSTLSKYPETRQIIPQRWHAVLHIDSQYDPQVQGVVKRQQVISAFPFLTDVFAAFIR